MGRVAQARDGLSRMSLAIALIIAVTVVFATCHGVVAAAFLMLVLHGAWPVLKGAMR